MLQSNASLLDLLTSLTTEHDSSILAQATSQLSTVWLKSADTIPALLQIAAEGQSVPVRQLAAVEAKKLVEKNDGQFWIKLNETVREAIKSNILKITVDEQNNLVRHSLARVISEIAKLEMMNMRWQELVVSLYNLCVSPIVSHREVGVYVIYSLLDVIADHLSDRMLDLLRLFSSTINDQESLMVAVTTVQALGSLSGFIEGNKSPAFSTFKSLVPSMVQVFERTLQSGDDDSASKISEIFEDMLALEVPLLSAYFADLIKFYLNVAKNSDASDSIRILALAFIMQASVYKKVKYQKLGLIGITLDAILPIAAEVEPSDRDEQYPGKVALQVLNSLATTFPPNHVFPSVMSIVVNYSQQENPELRKASMLALAVLVEGCADHMRERIGDILPIIIRMLQDPFPVVRRCACTALGSLCEELDSEVVEQHGVLFPLLFSLLGDENSQIHPNVLNTLDSLVESMEDSIQLYLEPLMGKLISLLTSPSRKVVLTTVNCIGSVAHAAGTDFLPYFEVTMQKLQLLMSIENKDDLEIRGVATDAVSTVAEAVGRDAFAPYMNGVMKLAVSGITLDNSRLRECSYVFFGVLSRVFGPDFSPFLSDIVPNLIQSCSLKDQEWNSLLADSDKKESMSEDLSECDENDDESANFNFNSAISHEKESSLEALAQLFSATRSAFLPFLDSAVNVAVSLLQNFHQGVRSSAAQCLLRFFSTCYSMAGQSEWEAGLPLSQPVHQNVASMGKLVFESIFLMLEEEEDRMVVSQTLQEFTETLKLTGPVGLSLPLCMNNESSGICKDVLLGVVTSVLNSEHYCQALEDDEGYSQEDEDLAELDALVISVAADVVGAMSAALGSGFAGDVRPLLPLIAKHYQKNKPVSDRNMAVGALAEICEGLEDGVTPFTNDLLTLFGNALRDEDDEVRSNAAFAISVLIANSSVELSNYYADILKLIEPLFGFDSKTNAVDNACGAISRMILKNPKAVPLETYVPAILNCLPLKRDYQENTVIYECILKLLQVQTPVLLSRINVVVSIFAQVLSPPPGQLKDGTRAGITTFLESLKASHFEEFNQMLGSLRADEATVVRSIIR